MLAPATLAALPSTRAIPDRDVSYVADPLSSIETRSRPRLLAATRHGFTFYVADPLSSIQVFASRSSTGSYPMLGKWIFSL